MAGPVIAVQGLQKRYGDRTALAGVDLEVNRGEIFCFLGPNGAGKTTTVEILEGYRRRSAGAVRVLGMDPEQGGRQLRDRIGIMLQDPGVPQDLAVAEVLDVFRHYYSRPRGVEELLALVGLSGLGAARVEHLSGGQRRRLDLALALVGTPELVFLDEPTTGFDPAARRAAWETISGLRDLGTTVFLTTHYLEEAQALADRVAVIADGRIVAEGPPERIGGRDRQQAVVGFRLPPGVTAGELPDLNRAFPELQDHELQIQGDRVTLRTVRPDLACYVLVGWALERRVELASLTVERPSLEDIYLQLTARADPATVGEEPR